MLYFVIEFHQVSDNYMYVLITSTCMIYDCLAHKVFFAQGHCLDVISKFEFFNQWTLSLTNIYNTTAMVSS